MVIGCFEVCPVVTDLLVIVVGFDLFSQWRFVCVGKDLTVSYSIALNYTPHHHREV
jgi:hypothetical protein